MTHLLPLLHPTLSRRLQKKLLIVINPSQAHPLKLRQLTADAASKLDVLGHHCDSLAVNSTQLCILEEADEVGLRRLLKGRNGRRAKALYVGVILCDFSRMTLEGELADEQLPRALKLADFPQGDRARPVAALDSGLATGLGLGRPPGSSQRQRTRRLAASGPPRRLLGPGHDGRGEGVVSATGG